MQSIVKTYLVVNGVNTPYRTDLSEKWLLFMMVAGEFIPRTQKPTILIVTHVTEGCFPFHSGVKTPGYHQLSLCDKVELNSTAFSVCSRL